MNVAVVGLQKTTGNVLVQSVAAIYCRNFAAPDSGYCGSIRNLGTGYPRSIAAHSLRSRPGPSRRAHPTLATNLAATCAAEILHLWQRGQGDSGINETFRN